MTLEYEDSGGESNPLQLIAAEPPGPVEGDASKITFALATADKARAYYGGDPPFSFRGYIALLEDRPIGVGGVYFINDQPWAFSEMKPEMRPRLKDKARSVRLLEKLIASYKTPVHAAAAEPTSEGLLLKLGFVPTGQTVAQGPVFVRMPCTAS